MRRRDGNWGRSTLERRNRLEEQSRALVAQRDALLPKLLSGEVGVGEVRVDVSTMKLREQQK